MDYKNPNAKKSPVKIQTNRSNKSNSREKQNNINNNHQ